MGVKNLFGVTFLAFLAAACGTKHNPAVCEADSDCTDSSRPFCDIDGEYPESNHIPGECTVKPANCPVSRCGCMPGEALACSNGIATVCGADGMSSGTQNCSLGCSSAATGCASFEPSNGLGPSLVDANAQVDVALPTGSHIDTDLGVVQDASGVPIAVKTQTVTQDAGQPSIFVLEGKSFIVDDISVTGRNAVALVAPGSITIRGQLDASAHQGVAGPGAQLKSAVCTGSSAQWLACSPGQQFTFYYSNGAGGGGNATPGGAGGATDAVNPPGTLVPTFVPLLGGCSGGDVTDSSMVSVYGRGGGGGGAVQLVSRTGVLIEGIVNLAGGGGGASGGSAQQSMGSGGGGSAGLLIVESPTLEFRGPGGVVANGGAGGGCGVSGADGSLTTTAATNASCGNAGRGGTGISSPTAGASCYSSGQTTCACLNPYAAGGGAAGRVHVVTSDGSFMASSSPLMSAAVTTSTLMIK